MSPKKVTFWNCYGFSVSKSHFFGTPCVFNAIMSMILLGQWSWCPSPPAWGQLFYSALLPAPARWFSHLILIFMSMTFDLHNCWPWPSYFGKLTVLLRSDCMPAQLALVSLSLGRFWSLDHPLVNLSLNQISNFFRLFLIVVRRLLLLGGEEVQHNRKGEKIFIGRATTIVLEISSKSIIYIEI